MDDFYFSTFANVPDEARRDGEEASKVDSNKTDSSKTSQATSSEATQVANPQEGTSASNQTTLSSWGFSSFGSLMDTVKKKVSATLLVYISLPLSPLYSAFPNHPYLIV